MYLKRIWRVLHPYADPALPSRALDKGPVGHKRQGGVMPKAGPARFDSSTGFRLPNGAERSLDASWLRRDRWQTLTTEQREGFVPLCPDFVVKLRSKTDSLAKLRQKMRESIDKGARLGWLDIHMMDSL